jgi:hypothetical protein
MANIRRGAVVAALACGLLACTSLPDVTQVRAPTMDFGAFEIRDWNSYAKNQASTRAVGANDLVDPSGRCAGTAMGEPGADGPTGPQTGAPVPSARGVGLDMTECEVVSALGPPQNVDVSANERGERNVIFTYVGSDRSGTYHFVGGRLVSLERGPEPATPPVAQKKPAKKQAKPKQAQPTT